MHRSYMVNLDVATTDIAVSRPKRKTADCAVGPVQQYRDRTIRSASLVGMCQLPTGLTLDRKLRRFSTIDREQAENY